MTQQRLTDRFGLFNDTHLVPGGFFVLRTGVTLHLSEQAALTAGYAYLGLPQGGVTVDYQRAEHRPWAQLQHARALGPRTGLSTRLRYDLRHRRNVADGRLRPGFSTMHRARLQLALRRSLPALTFAGFTPFTQLADELLVNLGPGVRSDRIDQHRVSWTLGVARDGVSLQAGYMNRTVLLPAGGAVMNHTALLWITHRMDGRALIAGRDASVSGRTPASSGTPPAR